MRKTKSLIIIILMLLMAMLLMQTAVSAETMTLKAQKLREGLGGETKYAYKINQKDVWKIYKAEADYSKAIYCLEAGVGNLWSGNLSGVEYDTQQAMKSSINPQSTMIESLGTNPLGKLNLDEGYNAPQALKSNANKGSILWLLDNFYLPKHENAIERQEMRDALLSAAFADWLAEPLTQARTLDDLRITDDDIEVVQQWALWQFTTENNIDVGYTTTNLPEIQVATGTNDSDLGPYIPLSDINRLIDDQDPNYMSGEYRQEEASMLFDYLVTNARANSTYNPEANTLNLEFANTNPKFNNKVVGPFRITSTDVARLYDFSLVIKDKNGTVIPAAKYKLTDVNGTTTYTADTSIIGNTFYVQLLDDTIDSITIEIKAKYTISTVIEWSNTGSGVKEQDVVIIEKTPGELPDDITVKEDVPPPPPEGKFDLALRKFITKVISGDEEKTYSREPIVDVSDLKSGKSTTAKYQHSKIPVPVKKGDIVEYTIRVYNEGEIDGYAEKVLDDIPEGLEFLRTHDTNLEYRWQLVTPGLKQVTTDYLSKAQETSTERKNLIKAFNPDTMTTLDYKDVKIVFKVVADDTVKRVITNTAEIIDDADKDGNEVEDRDSTPGNNDLSEDDIDQEHVVLQHFDLSLTKFLTEVDGVKVIDRYKKPIVNTDGTIQRDFSGKQDSKGDPKPYKLEQNSIVVYTITVYNEGLIDGYAKEVTDDIPEGLEFLPDHEINKEHRWVESSDGKSVSTDYLSKEQEKTAGENLIKAFDKDTMDSPDFKEILIAFKVKPLEQGEKGKVIINTAEITDDEDKDGNEVEDVDSTPGNEKEGEDDIDEEYIYVKYFDLSLLKWVTKAILIDDGKETVIESGNTGAENPEPPLKVDINRWRLNKVTLKFVFNIKVTNEGEIAGYAKEVSDYIPSGLEFVAQDNPKWTLDGNVAKTDQLKDTLIKPGESVTITITLRWKNNPDNMGAITNAAEITKDENGSGTLDIDSKPSNKVPEEDDYDTAPILVSIVTGDMTVYYVLPVTIIAILGAGVFLIKRYVI